MLNLYVPTVPYRYIHICTQDLSPQDELPNNWDQEEEQDLDESEPWYGNDVDRAEYYEIDDGPQSPVLSQCLYYDEDDSMTESELELDIKRVFNSSAVRYHTGKKNLAGDFFVWKGCWDRVLSQLHSGRRRAKTWTLCCRC